MATISLINLKEHLKNNQLVIKFLFASEKFMPKCKYCHENITKFDREFCPFCGGHNPLEGNDCLTQDITQTIDVLKSEKELM